MPRASGEGGTHGGRWHGGRWRKVAIAAAALLAALAVASQLALPRIAERRLEDRLSANGTVERVDVRAFPAVELLWNRTDRVTVRMRDARAAAGRFADLLADTRDVERLDARVRGLNILTLRFREMRLAKRGRTIVGSATVSRADLRAALPGNLDVRPVASGAGALVFEGTGTVLGRRLRAQAMVAVRNGTVVLAPNVLFGGFLSLTIFSDPRIEVLSVGARARPDGFTIAARARLRD